MGRFFDTTLHRPAADDREQRIVDGFEHDARSGKVEMLARDLVAELERGQAPSEPALARIARVLDEHEADEAVRTGFWHRLAQRFPDHAYVLACHGDALLHAGREGEAMDAFLAAFAIAPTLTETFDEAADLAYLLGGTAWLEYQLAELRAALAMAEAASTADHSDDDDDRDDGDGDDEDGDDGELDVRERYSELLDEYREDPAALAAIRAVGHRITELENSGVLPRALVRRGDWRR